MPQFMRYHVHPVSHTTWAIPILAGILAGFLLAFIANYLKETRWILGAMKAQSVVSAAPDPAPAPELRKPVRYGAVISNWKQYRAANPPLE